LTGQLARTQQVRAGYSPLDRLVILGRLGLCSSPLRDGELVKGTSMPKFDALLTEQQVRTQQVRWEMTNLWGD
jgi:hypothetical protein